MNANYENEILLFLNSNFLYQHHICLRQQRISKQEYLKHKQDY